jgi:hypothetical protein
MGDLTLSVEQRGMYSYENNRLAQQIYRIQID